MSGNVLCAVSVILSGLALLTSARSVKAAAGGPTWSSQSIFAASQPIPGLKPSDLNIRKST